MRESLGSEILHRVSFLWQTALPGRRDAVPAVSSLGRGGSGGVPALSLNFSMLSM